MEPAQASVTPSAPIAYYFLLPQPNGGYSICLSFEPPTDPAAFALTPLFPKDPAPCLPSLSTIPTNS